ncbi:MAG: hypothetical protein QM784_23530 [Polyangiaceae bacterium]
MPLSAFLGGWARIATAQSSDGREAEPSTTALRLREEHRVRGIHLEQAPGGAVGIDGYSGIGMLAMDGRRVGHAYYGGLLRASYGYFELGGQLERSDRTKEQWSYVGGFAGAHLPYTNWVDVHSTVGIGIRSFDNDDRRYGPSGAKVSVPSLAFRLAITDRSTETGFAACLGAAFFAQFDLARHSVPWEYRIRDVVISQGQTVFGGLTVGLMMSLGLDLAFASRGGVVHPRNSR